MEESKDTDINLFTNSYSTAASLSFEENVQSNAGNPLSFINENIETKKENAEVNHSEMPPIQVTDGSSLEQQTTGSPEISNETGPPVDSIVAVSSEIQCVQRPQFSDDPVAETNGVHKKSECGVPVVTSDVLQEPQSLDNSKTVMNAMPQQSKDVVSGNTVNVQKDCKTTGEVKATDNDQKEKGSTSNESRELTEASGDVKHVNMNRNLVGTGVKASKGYRMEDGNAAKRTLSATETSGDAKHENVNRGLVDTAAPFESVKEAVTKFGGIVDWKAHKSLILERHKHIQLELEKTQEEIPEYKKQSEAAENAKVQVLKELDSTKRLIEELKLSLEKSQMEEAQARQDSELAQLRAKEMEQGITDEVSVAAKAQLDVAKARHAAAVTELKSVKEELETVKGEYVSLLKERDLAIKRAEEAAAASKDVEKTVEDLTLELITARESLESAHAAHLEAEEHRIGAALARDQDLFNWEKELKQAEEEVQRLNNQLLRTRDLKSKLDTASNLLLSLKGELAAYMEAKQNQESEIIEEDGTKETKGTHTSIRASIDSAKKELEEVNSNIEKAKDEVNCLRVAAMSLKAELEKERATLAPMRQREGMASITVSSLEAELDRIISQIELAQSKEKEAREQMVELPKALQQAAQEADEAKSAAQVSQEELRKAKEESEQVKASASTMEIRLHAALKEIEAAKASERLALAAVRALQESEQAASTGFDDSPGGVTLPLEEYYLLSKRAREAEESASERVATAISQIEVAKESELGSLERLEAVNRELMESKEALKVATEKAEKAQEGKLAVEQELRQWRAEHEQRRRAGDAARSAANPTRSPLRSFEEHKEQKRSEQEQEVAVLAPPVPAPKTYLMESNTESALTEPKTRKKKSLLPRIVMFLARKKAQR
uniref:Protein WEAK CHLOROPLAST MOVEMENT UNDER BLUE LIGHT 1 n=1 Tax=Anthurium amnicola TaxID=1678845 RepID=A0A1D1YJJ9_9ARAE